MPTTNVPNLTNIIVGMAKGYTSPVGTAMPLDTVTFDTPWTTPWTYWGATDAGVQFNVNKNTTEHHIEEQSNPALVTVESSQFQVVTTLAEDTLETMKLAYGGGTLTTQAAATGTIGKKTLTLSDTLQQLALGFEGLGPEGFWRRVSIPVVIAAGQVGTPYRRSNGKRVYPVTFSAICAPSQVKIDEMTAAAL